MGSVRIVGVTEPRIPGIRTAEELIAYVARVSNPSNQNNTETAGKLLKYLVNNKHWSPFEMVNVVMEINTTRDIGRQILRHRSFAFQEFSQRYSSVDALGFEYREARLQDNKNRQNSLETDNNALKDKWAYMQSEILTLAEEVYEWALKVGIAKEQARAVLPEGMTKSRMYMNGSLRSWIHYIFVREPFGTQKEHRAIAIDAKDALILEFPSIAQIFDTLEEGTKNE